MRLPHAERASVDIRKLRDYALNPAHARGRHKARVFESALGLTQADAQELQTALLTAARLYDAVLGEADEHGQRFVIEFEMERKSKRAIIRSGWIIRKGENFARLASWYIVD